MSELTEELFALGYDVPERVLKVRTNKELITLTNWMFFQTRRKWRGRPSPLPEWLISFAIEGWSGKTALTSGMIDRRMAWHKKWQEDESLKLINQARKEFGTEEQAR